MSFFVEAPDFAPYQGCIGEWVNAIQHPGGKSFGYFCCLPCDKKWMSAHARKGYKQGCKDCERFYYPLYLWENTHKKSNLKENPNNDKPHIKYLCQACKMGICIR